MSIKSGNTRKKIAKERKEARGTGTKISVTMSPDVWAMSKFTKETAIKQIKSYDEIKGQLADLHRDKSVTGVQYNSLIKLIDGMSHHIVAWDKSGAREELGISKG